MNTAILILSIVGDVCGLLSRLFARQKTMETAKTVNELNNSQPRL